MKRGAPTTRTSPTATDQVEAETCRDTAGELVVQVATGPDCRAPVAVGSTRIVVGRDRAATVVLDDPAVAPHHALLALDPDEATLTVTPLVGSSPVWVDGQPVVGSTVVDVGACVCRLGLGGSSLEVGVQASFPVDEQVAAVGAPLLTPSTSNPSSIVVHRRFQVASVAEARPIGVPQRAESLPGPPATALVGAAVSCVGALVVATLMGSPMFALFGAVAAVGAFATWAASWIGVLRTRRRRRVEWAAATARFSDEVAAAVRSAAAAARRASPVERALASASALEATSSSADDETTSCHIAAPGLWCDRPAVDECEDGGLGVVVGRGSRRWSPPLDGVATADLPHDVADAAARLDDVPIEVRLQPGRAVGLVGSGRAAVARSIIMQLAWNVGPSDWQLVIVTDRPTVWRWTVDLPHAQPRGGPDRLVALDHGTAAALLELRAELGEVARNATSTTGAAPRVAGEPSKRPLPLVVVDLRGDVGGPSGPIRSFLAAVGAAALVVADHASGWVDEVLEVGLAGRLVYASTAAGPAGTAAPIGVSLATATNVAARLRGLVDPELPTGEAPPRSCSFASVQRQAVDGVDPFDPDAVAAAWERSGPDPAPTAVLGATGTGVALIDLAADGPHALIAGTTGSGKSELLRTLVAGLAVRSSPRHLAFVLIDYKGGAAFDACADLPHVVGSVTDLDDGLAARALSSLHAELHRRERLLREVGASDLTELRRLSGSDAPGSALVESGGGAGTRAAVPRLVVVVDEFATLAKELPDFLSSLVDVAQRGRSLGVHLVLATQRPGGVVGDDVRANTALRIALRVQERAESLDVIGVDRAANLPRSSPGRALRVDGGDLVEFQTASCTTPTCTGDATASPADDAADTELERVVAAIRTAADAEVADARQDSGHSDDTTKESSGLRHVIWLPPLPTSIAAAELADELAVAGGSGRSERGVARRPEPIGVIDDPAGQRRLALRWAPGDGSLAIVGSLGSGTTSTLLAIGAAACGSMSPDELHVYVVDARGDERLDAFAAIAHCGGVIRAGETERLRRLLARLSARPDGDDGSGGTSLGGTRCGLRAVNARSRRTVVLVDGLDALRAQLDRDDTERAAALRSLVRDGADRGVEVVATSATDLVTLGATMRDAWVGAVDDQMTARALGWTGPPVRRDVPGRVRVASSGLEAQVALGAPGLASLPSAGDTAGGPQPIRCLPARITDAVLTSSGSDADDSGFGPGPDGTVEGTNTLDRPLPIGLAADTFAVAGPPLEPGGRLLVAGRPGAGVTTTLTAIARAWARRHAGTVHHIVGADDLVALLDLGVAQPRSGRTEGCVDQRLLVIDDATRLDDPSGRLSALLDQGAGRGGPTVIAGGRADELRSAYGHWTRRLLTDDRGIALAASGEPPTDLFGVSAPRRPLVAPRVGLAWLVDRGSVRAVQIALPDGAADGHPPLGA
ncbi:MAG: FtsK/SpoIIIE domain-containing protein [Actinomycetota bacterium]